ncbi:MAG: hypothetical protein M5U11_11875 [Anaerolineales bacterium]|nr:hypothetical protein [Anaerolineales bacterium]
MTYAQVVNQVKRMSYAEKLALMKTLADSLVHEAPATARKRTLKHLFGVLRPKMGRVPSNKELRKEYRDYPGEKYK